MAFPFTLCLEEGQAIWIAKNGGLGGGGEMDLGTEAEEEK